MITIMILFAISQKHKIKPLLANLKLTKKALN